LASDMKSYRGTAIQLGPPTSMANCPGDPLDTGDYCSKMNEQCLYPVVGVASGAILAPSFWGCNCNHKANQYVCDVRCVGGECIGASPPTPVPPKQVRDGAIPQPPNYSWCPTNHPGHHQTCEYVGVECSYSFGTTVEKCECDIVSYGAGRENWDYLWICDHDPDYM